MQIFSPIFSCSWSAFCYAISIREPQSRLLPSLPSSMEVDPIKQAAKAEIDSFLNENPNGTIIIRGATATGKSKLSVLLSEYFPTEIISADSRQIFRLMDIGTDKISQDIRNQIPHHQIDIVNPDETYTAGQRKEDSEHLIEESL
jgi:hypothetical protein